MKLLADENVGHRIINYLRNAGHEVTAIAETQSGAEDTIVLHMAVQLQIIL